ncbi:hypothetical protein ACOSQ4_000014 [Xanthoceras sorbifolium]
MAILLDGMPDHGHTRKLGFLVVGSQFSTTPASYSTWFLGLKESSLLSIDIALLLLLTHRRSNGAVEEEKKSKRE